MSASRLPVVAGANGYLISYPFAPSRQGPIFPERCLRGFSGLAALELVVPFAVVASPTTGRRIVIDFIVFRATEVLILELFVVLLRR